MMISDKGAANLKEVKVEGKKMTRINNTSPRSIAKEMWPHSQNATSFSLFFA